MGGSLMRATPRLALATSATGLEPSAVGLSMLGALTDLGWRVQHFRAWACPVSQQRVGPITGLPGRHLDTWLMPPDVCLRVFERGARTADLAVVEGTLGPQPAHPEPDLSYLPDYTRRPGPLADLATLLDLPRIGVVDCRGWREPSLPLIPDNLDGVIFDGLQDRELFPTLRALAQHLRGLPVLGAIDDLPGARATLEKLPLGAPIPTDLVHTLSRSFRRYVDLHAIKTLSTRGPLPIQESPECPPPRRRTPFRVAYAMDDAFGGYFPDTLEALEMLGAELVEFSPLRDGSLPTGIDLLMIGCGFPDHYAHELAANLSLISEMRHQVCKGLRIYAEGGGAAYLARFLIIDGQNIPGAGILPIDAELRTDQVWPEPVERTLARDGWLGPRGTAVRGYISSRWRLHPAPEPGDCPVRSGPLSTQGDMYFRCHAVGSLIHLHLATLPSLVQAFASDPVASLPTPHAGARF